MMGSGVAGLLIASAAGYWVVTQAEHQKGGARKLGIYLGAAIIVISLIGAACKVYAIVTCANAPCPISGGMYCPMKKSAWGPTMKPSAPMQRDASVGQP